MAGSAQGVDADGARGCGTGAGTDRLFAGPGEVRALARDLDWAATPLGDVPGWPAALRTAVRLMLAAPLPTSLWVGPAFALLYNDAYARLIGVNHPGALGRPGAAAWAEAWPSFAARFAAVRAGGPPEYADGVLIPASRGSGGVVEDAWFTYGLSALTDEDGQCVAVYNVAVEVTTRTRAERQARFLAELSEALQPLTDPDAVMATAARLLGDHVGADRCAYAEVEADEDHFTITGDYARGDMPRIAGRFAMSAFGAEALRLSREDRPYVVDDAEADPRVTAAERAVYAQTRIRAVISVPLRKDGRFVAGMAVHQRTPRRWTSEDVALVSMVTQRCWESIERARAVRSLHEREAALRATTEQLAERTAAAEQAARLKAEFLATMSHEFRTPLNAILGYTQLLDMGVLGAVSPAQHAHLERLEASGRHLLRLVDDVLDVAKVDADRLDVREDVLPTSAVVAAALALVQPQATAKGIRILDLGAAGPGVPYVGDEHRARQILVNLLSNAVKFTPPGGQITVTCGAAAEPEPGVVPGGPGAAQRRPENAPPAGWAFVQVEDTGPGLDPELVGRLFEPFVQADGALTREQGGTGLGLAISRRLARLMGGDLVARTRPGAGATFTLWLPGPADADAAPAAGPARLPTPARSSTSSTASPPAGC